MVKTLIGAFALPKFKAMDQALSDSQRDALEKGTVGWEGSVFRGKPDWEALKNTPPPQLSAEEKSFLENETEQLCQMIDDWKIRNELNDLSPEVWQFLKEKKFFALIIPKNYGGLGFSAYAHSEIMAKIISRSGTVGATTMVPNSLGPAELLMNYGTTEQRNHYLPRLADGRDIPCFALTSAQAGSDATNQSDEGTVFKGEDGKLYIRMNWDKRYTTLAPVATLFGIAFNLKDPDDLLGKGAEPGITLALVPRDLPGIEAGARHRPLGVRIQNGPHWGRDVVIPVDAIIGGAKNAGRGWNMLVDCLSIGRAISLPASSNGLAQSLARVTGAYAYVRNQFGMPIAKMEGIQEPLARIGGMTYIVDSARVLPLQDLDLAHAKGTEARPAASSAILKYHMTEFGRKTAIDAMDIHGGKGVCEGPNNPVADCYQSVTVGITVEGANIMTRSLMIFGQSAFLLHPYVLQEMAAARRNDKKETGRLALRHLFNMLGNAGKGFVYGLTNGWMSPGMQPEPGQKKGAEAPFYAQINRLSAGFAYAADLSMILLQSRLMRMERTSALLGDALSHLYMAGQILRRFRLDGSPAEDIPLMRWAATYCLYRAEDALFELCENHPSRFARMALKPLLFPRGRLYRPPGHRLDAQVADLLSTPGAARDRLTRGMYIPQDQTDYVARLERAFLLCHEAEPHEKALQKAVRQKQLSQSENYGKMVQEALEKNLIDTPTYDLLIRTMQARADIVQVDHFAQNWVGTAQQPVAMPKQRPVNDLHAAG